MATIGKLEVKTCNFTWIIDNFSKRGEKIGDIISSPIFSTGEVTQSQWRLVLYPYGDIEESKDHLSGYMQVIFANCLLRTYIFRLSLLDDVGNERFEANSYLKQYPLPNNSWGWPQFCKRDNLMNEKDTLLINDTLKIFCSVTLNPYSKEEFEKEIVMQCNYETLYSTAPLSDLTIIVGAKEIRAHKNILSVRSKVFSAMFEHDMKERNTNTIEIDDISYEVMDELLLFLYCGKVRNVKKLAKPLLIAADKYDINSLKMICERTLFENLQVENACETLLVADRFNCTKLKSETIDFIIKNIKAITPTPKFRELKISNAELLEEIVCKIAEDK